MRRLVRLALVLALVAVPAAAGAQDRPEPAAGYEGVVPGRGNPPPATQRLARRATRRARQRTAILTWPGFQMMPDGSSRFFVQTTEPVQTEVRTTAERVEVVFRNTAIHLANSARWLETRHFETPVQRARLERRGHDMVFVMYLRAAVTPQVSSAGGAQGESFQYTYIDFAAGRYRPTEPEPMLPPAGGVGTVRGGEAAPSEAPQPTPRDDEGQAIDDERPPAVRGPTPKR